MPEFFRNKNADNELMLWHITEPLDFFISKMNNWQPDFLLIKNETRKLQFAASRYVAGLLMSSNDASQFANAEDRRPFIKNSELKISISHDENFVAVIIGKNSVGIDVFCPTEKVFKIAKRFLCEDEINYLNSISYNEKAKLKWYSLAWCVKETAFKFLGKDGVEFHEDLIIQKINSSEILMNTTFQGEIKINFRVENDFLWSWIS
jgi:phosphopantetheinyl transferase